MMGDGKSFTGRLIKTDGKIEDLELHSDEFFLDRLLEEEVGISSDLIDFYLVNDHAIAFNTMARALNQDDNRNGTASSLVGFDVFGNVVFIPRQFIREA